MSAIYQLGRVIGRFAAHLADRLAAWIVGDDWNRHVNQALRHFQPPEHDIRPMFDALPLGENDVAMYCRDCSAMLNGRWDYPGAILAAANHRRDVHTAVTA